MHLVDGMEAVEWRPRNLDCARRARRYQSGDIALPAANHAGNNAADSLADRTGHYVGCWSAGTVWVVHGAAVLCVVADDAARLRNAFACGSARWILLLLA